MKKESVKAINAEVTEMLTEKLEQFTHASLFDIKVKATVYSSRALFGDGKVSLTVTPWPSLEPAIRHSLAKLAEALFFELDGAMVEGREANWKIKDPSISSKDGWYFYISY